jgi:hypothetical protein
MKKRDPSKGKRHDAFGHALALIRDVCGVAGTASLIEDARADLARTGVIEAVQHHDDTALFGWLLDVMSYQGISDVAAWTYMERHGRVAHGDVAAGLEGGPPCPKLKSYWHFSGCGYRKTAQICNEPNHFQSCPLPKHDLRNGNLNQAAYGLHLFMRDITNGDFVRWIDARLALVDRPRPHMRSQSLVDALIAPLRNVHGLSDKVLNMSLSMLLLAGDPNRKAWVTAGTAMIAIDTLVHNWFHRTGILARLNAEHPYGPRCYTDHGCASIIGAAARKIDARAYNPEFPPVFPRFVQFAIWRFCSQAGFNQCNGNTVRDGTRCTDADCPLFAGCDRIALPLIRPIAA